MDSWKVEDLKRLYHEHGQLLRGFFQGQGFSAQDAEDMTQETFMKAVQGLSEFRGDAGLKTWLFEIARNVIRHELRRRRAAKRDAPETPIEDWSEEQSRARGSSAAGKLAAGEQEHPLSRLLSEETLRLVSEALADLPPKMRNCMLLYTHQERKYREIAVLTRLSINTVKSHIHQARQLLKARLGDHFDCLGR